MCKSAIAALWRRWGIGRLNRVRFDPGTAAGLARHAKQRFIDIFSRTPGREVLLHGRMPRVTECSYSEALQFRHRRRRGYSHALPLVTMKAIAACDCETAMFPMLEAAGDA